LGNLGLSAVQVHIFLHLAEDVGLSRTAGGLVWSIASLTNIPFRLMGGFMGDRMPKNIILGVATGFMAASVFALANATSFSTAMLFSVPFGIGWGMFTPIMNSIQGEYFRGKSQGVIRGWLQTVSLPFSIAAPVLVGLAADRQGNYFWAFSVTSAAMMAGAVLNLLATHPRRGSRRPGR
jgi:MFS family permease